MIALKDYQIKAIGELTEKVLTFLNKSEKAVITFKSPTGSGKTLMVSELLKKRRSRPKLKHLYCLDFC